MRDGAPAAMLHPPQKVYAWQSPKSTADAGHMIAREVRARRSWASDASREFGETEAHNRPGAGSYG
jgi:hypothetical protein